MDLFGYKITKKLSRKEEEKLISFAPKPEEDGVSSVITAGGGYYGQYVDIDGDKTSNDRDLILKYREAAQQPECDSAISDIVDASISSGVKGGAPVELDLSDLDQPDNVKKQILEEFDNILRLYKFNLTGESLFRQWYIDGRIYFHIIIDDVRPNNGIKELRLIEPLHMKKVKEIKKIPDSKSGVTIQKVVGEYYIYSEDSNTSMTAGQSSVSSLTGVKIAKEAIVDVSSGILDASKRRVVSYIHKALKPVNQLRMMEDSLVMYRVARAPERRIFYIDVGNLPKGKAEEYVQSIMGKYRNKLVYDASTGDIKDDRRHMSMLEDFWLPRREGGRGTEITTLPGGDNLGQIDDILFFQKKLFKSLNVPISRLEADSTFNLGRSSEISRDEVKFQKFIDRIRKRFSSIFLEALKVQLILKGIISKQDWDEMKEEISIDYISDSHFAELKENEVLKERLEMLDTISDHIGKFYSINWVRRNILQQNDEDIKEIDKEIEEEKDMYDDDDDDM